jgi:hypothetical protein
MVYNYLGLPAPDYVSASIINASTGEVALNWGEVASAEFYRLFISSVPLGEPAGSYSNSGDFTVTSYTGTFGTNMRKYFYVVSGKSGGILSSPSDSVYVDL